MSIFKLKGKLIGTLKKDGVYVSFRTPEHYFRKYNGFGISTSILINLKRAGCKKILIIYQETPETQIKYSTYPNRFLEKGIIYKDGKRDYQRILPLTYFNKENEILQDLQSTLI